MKRLAIGGAILAICGTGLAWAQGANVPLPAEQIIAARQAAYDFQGAMMEAMKQAVQDKADVKVFRDGADAIVHWSATLPGMFPPGTEQGHNTHALPKIWSDHADFAKAAANLNAAAQKLSAAAAADDKAAFAAAFQETGKACGACHREFRAK